jgi:PKD repeat protein
VRRNNRCSAGRGASVNIPSGDLRLNRQFDVTSTGTTTILLDFDGDQSVKQTGNGAYTMTPVMSVVSVQ